MLVLYPPTSQFPEPGAKQSSIIYKMSGLEYFVIAPENSLRHPMTRNLGYAAKGVGSAV
jgi:hypothetical protein